MTSKIILIVLLVISFFCLLYPADILDFISYNQNIQEATLSLRITALTCLFFFLVLFFAYRRIKTKRKKIFSIKSRDKLSFYRDAKTTFPFFSLLLFFFTILTGTVFFATHLYNDKYLHANPDVQARQGQILVKE